MSYFVTDNTPFANRDALLVKSIRIYQEISELYGELQDKLANQSAKMIQQAILNLANLSLDAKTIDNLISENFKNVRSFPDSTTTLLNQRKNILINLQQSNLQVVNNAKNMRSLLKHEITSMAKGHNAIKGYKQVETRTKNIVRGSF